VSVKLQADADNTSWGAPTLDAAITIPGEDEDGRASMPWLDLTGVTGYDVGGFRYWRLIVAAARTRSASASWGCGRRSARCHGASTRVHDDR